MKISLPLIMLPLCLAAACATSSDADSTASETDGLSPAVSRDSPTGNGSPNAAVLATQPPLTQRSTATGPQELPRKDESVEPEQMNGIPVGATPGAADADQTEVDTAEVAANFGAGTNGFNGFGHIRLSNTNLCVQPSGDFDGAALGLRTCSSSTSQNWLFASFPSTNDFRIFNQASGLCVNNASEPTKNGGTVIQGECNIRGTSRPVSNARWHPSSQAGFATLESELNGSAGLFCIDVPSGIGFDGARLQMFRCNGTPAQVFVIQ